MAAVVVVVLAQAYILKRTTTQTHIRTQTHTNSHATNAHTHARTNAQSHKRTQIVDDIVVNDNVAADVVCFCNWLS